MKKTTTTTTVRCDGDDCIQAGVGPAVVTVEVARARGWLLTDGRDLCPKCRSDEEGGRHG